MRKEFALAASMHFFWHLARGGGGRGEEFKGVSKSGTMRYLPATDGEGFRKHSL